MLVCSDSSADFAFTVSIHCCVQPDCIIGTVEQVDFLMSHEKDGLAAEIPYCTLCSIHCFWWWWL